MTPQQLFEFYAQAYKLKITLRHCWLGTNHRQESVADHTWGLTLLACLIIPHLQVKVDPLKVIKMLIYHDLAEALTGDIPATIKSSMVAEDIHKAEYKALQKLVSPLPKKLQSEILDYWKELEAAETNEALVANAIDKAEAIIQHDLSDISTWEDQEYSMNVRYKDHFFNFDPYMRKLKDFINHYNYWLAEDAGRLDLLAATEQDYWQQNKSKHKFSKINWQ